MNNLALIASRELMFLEVSEAAKHIGGVEQRTWRYYEAGRSPIPDGLAEKMQDLLECRAEMLNRMSVKADEHRRKGEGRLVVPYYLSFEDYQKETGITDVVMFRLDQSVKASLYAEDKLVFY